MAALPYVDTELDAEGEHSRAAVNALVEQEIVASGGREKLLREYLARMGEAEGAAAPPQPLRALDATRYDDHDEEGSAGWTPERAAVVLEFARMAETNVRVMSKVGADTWHGHARRLERAAQRMEDDVGEAKRAVTAINAQRQAEQTRVGAELAERAEAWGALAYRAASMRGAIAALPASSSV